MLNERILNIDLDGVVYDWHGVFKEFCEERLGRELAPITRWDFHEDWGLSYGAFKNLFRRGVEYGHIWRYGPAIYGALEGLWQLSDEGYYIRLVTHRLAHKFGHKIATEATVKWLDEQSIPYRSLCVIGNEDKRNFFADALLDDRYSTVFQWNAHGGRNGIVFDRPWNREHVDGEPRVYGWEQAVEALRG